MKISSRACTRIEYVASSFYTCATQSCKIDMNTFEASECRVFLTLESQLSFQRGGAGPADRGAPRPEGLRLRRRGEQHDDPRAARDELQPEPESADHLGAVLVDLVVAAADEGPNQRLVADEEERQRQHEQAGAQEAEERRLAVAAAAREDAQRVVVRRQEGPQERLGRVKVHDIQGQQGQQEEERKELG